MHTNTYIKAHMHREHYTALKCSHGEKYSLVCTGIPTMRLNIPTETNGNVQNFMDVDPNTNAAVSHKLIPDETT